VYQRTETNQAGLVVIGADRSTARARTESAMPAILCDLCRQELRGAATEIRLARGLAGTNAAGRPFLVPRDDDSPQFFCARCAEWVTTAIDQLRNSLAS
jgi:hypothetical protein